MTQIISSLAEYRLHQIGPVRQDSYLHSIRVYHGVVTLIMSTTPDRWNWIFNRAPKQRNTGKHNAIVFVTSNCVKFRQEAPAKLSEIVELQHGRKCCPIATNTTNIRKWKTYQIEASMETTVKSFPTTSIAWSWKTKIILDILYYRKKSCMRFSVLSPNLLWYLGGI
jgi:hypothetical protein